MAERLGVSMSFTPATKAEPQPPRTSSPAAKCAATRLLLQAVSMEAAGPRRPKVKARRPAATLMAEPWEVLEWIAGVRG
jgi:hypothetical protein